MIKIFAVLRSPTFWIGMVLVVGYWPIAAMVPSEPQIEAEQAMRLALGAVVVIGYTPAVMRALTVRQPSYGSQLILGIAMSWVGSAGTSAWVLLWRLAERPFWMLQANVNGFFLWMQILGAVLHLTARRKRVRQSDKFDARLVIAAMLFGAALVTAVVIWRPDLRSFVEVLRPYLDDGF